MGPLSRWAVPVVGVALAAACGDAAAPVRTACADPGAPRDRCAYGFRHPDGFVFRWPRERLPVRIWVGQRGTIAGLVTQGISVWRSALLYGELDAVLVADSTRADVLVRLLDERDGAPNGPACGGFSEAEFLLRGDTVIGGRVIGPLTLLGPVRSSVFGRRGAGAEEVSSCLRVVIPHELGHAFGILAHSDDTLDLMAARPPRQLRLTDRDRITFEVLHHTPPSIKPHPR